MRTLGFTDCRDRRELIRLVFSHPPILQCRQGAVVHQEDQPSVVAAAIDYGFDWSSGRNVSCASVLHHESDDHSVRIGSYARGLLSQRLDQA